MLSPRANPLRTFRKVLWIGLALLILSAIGTIGFHRIEGWSWLDSLYMVVITFISIGICEMLLFSFVGVILTVWLFVAGAVFVALGIETLTKALLDFDLLHCFGRHKLER